MAKDYVLIKEGERLSIDGKSIRSTVSDYSTTYQKFCFFGSLFISRQKQVLHVEKNSTAK